MRIAPIVAAISATLLPLAGALPGDAPRPAAAILADLEAVEWPGVFSGLSNEEVERRVHASTRRECALAEELWRGHPDHPALARVLLSRWTLQRNVLHAHREVFDETSALLDGDPGPLRTPALYARAYAALDHPERTDAERFAIAEEALAVDPPDGDGEFAVGLLSDLAWNRTADPKRQRAIVKRVLTDWKATPSARELIDLHRLLKRRGERVDPAIDDVLDRDGLPWPPPAGRPVVLVVFSTYDFERGTSRYLAFEALKRLRADPDASLPPLAGILVDRDDSRLDRLERAVAAYGLDFPIAHHPVGDDTSFSASLGVWNTPCFLRLDGDRHLAAVCGRPGPALRDGEDG